MNCKCKNVCISASLVWKQQCKQYVRQHVCAANGRQAEGEKKKQSDNWQYNKSKGQHLTRLTSVKNLPISHKTFLVCLF